MELLIRSEDCCGDHISKSNTPEQFMQLAAFVRVAKIAAYSSELQF
jgi:hypothetical protein